jgi:hypothetical protein
MYKLALTTKEIRFLHNKIKSLEDLKILKIGPVLYQGLKLTIHVIKSQIHIMR